jgi:hypothetical protein
MPRIFPILPLLLAIPLRAAAQDGLERRNEAFLRAVVSAPHDSVAAFFPRRGDWTWTQVVEGAPPGRRPTVWRFAATETLRAIGGPVSESFWKHAAGTGPRETVLVVRIEEQGTRWRRVAGNRFVPPGASARSPVFVQWRREDGRWVVSAFGDATDWAPRVLGYSPHGHFVVPDTVLRPATPFYAAEAPWYVESQAIYFEDYRYTKYGLPRAIADTLSLRRVGRFGLIGVYIENRDATVLYIPVAPGQYQLYQVDHRRGPYPRIRVSGAGDAPGAGGTCWLDQVSEAVSPPRASGGAGVGMTGYRRINPQQQPHEVRLRGLPTLSLPRLRGTRRGSQRRRDSPRSRGVPWALGCGDAGSPRRRTSCGRCSEFIRPAIDTRPG